MEEIFNLDTYKELLINGNYAKSTSHKKQEKLTYLNEHYSDSYLMKIIKDTIIFYDYLLERLKNDHNYYMESIFYKTEMYGQEILHNDLCNNVCDWIMLVKINGKTMKVSKVLLQKVLTPSFRISFEQDEMEIFDDVKKTTYLAFVDKLNVIGPKQVFDKAYKLHNIDSKNKR